MIWTNLNLNLITCERGSGKQDVLVFVAHSVIFILFFKVIINASMVLKSNKQETH